MHFLLYKKSMQYFNELAVCKMMFFIFIYTDVEAEVGIFLISFGFLLIFYSYLLTLPLVCNH